MAITTLALNTTRTSGPAPLAVVFDAWGTVSDSATVEWTRVVFMWEIEGVVGSWGPFSRPKAVHWGPVCCAIFETSGSYQVSVTAWDSSGASATETQMITVQAESAVWAAGDTHVLSSSSDLGTAGVDYPAGATETPNATWSQVRDALLTDTLVMLYAGSSWTADSGRVLTLSNCRLRKYGQGSNPLISSTTSVVFFTGVVPSGSVSDLSVHEVDFNGGGDTSRRIFSQNTSAPGWQDMVFLRCGFDGCFPFNLGEQTGEIGTGLVVAQCAASNHGSHTNLFLGACQRSAFVGNTFTGPSGGEAGQCVRIGIFKRGLVGYNTFRNTQASGRALLRITANIHGGDDHNNAEDFHVCENLLDGGATAGGWLSEMAGIDDADDFHLLRAVIERNHFLFSTGAAQTVRALRVAGRDIDVRFNTFDDNGTPLGGQFVSLWKQPNMWQAQRMRVFHNSALVRSGQSNPIHLAQFGGGASDFLDTEIKNNLAWIGGGGGTMVAGSGTNDDIAGNLLADTGTNPEDDFFEGGSPMPSPTTLFDFRIVSGSPAEDGGEDINAEFRDIDFNRVGSSPDQGASSFDEGGGGGPSPTPAPTQSPMQVQGGPIFVRY